VVHAFDALNEDANNADGTDCTAGLTTPDGTWLFGTASAGGLNGTGTVFKISTGGQFALLHTFGPLGAGDDPNANATGATPSGPLVAGLVGPTGTGSPLPSGWVTMHTTSVLYGTASEGGQNGYGTLFRIDGAGTLTVLHDFNNLDGAAPMSGVTPQMIPYNVDPVTGEASAMTTVLVREGNSLSLYGTTSAGGVYGGGSVFRYDLGSGAFETLYHFFGR
jgi:uncharacterized repeat protein (TIGR03803 family)